MQPICSIILSFTKCLWSDRRIFFGALSHEVGDIGYLKTWSCHLLWHLFGIWRMLRFQARIWVMVVEVLLLFCLLNPNAHVHVECCVSLVLAVLHAQHFTFLLSREHVSVEAVSIALAEEELWEWVLHDLLPFVVGIIGPKSITCHFSKQLFLIINFSKL